MVLHCHVAGVLLHAVESPSLGWLRPSLRYAPLAIALLMLLPWNACAPARRTPPAGSSLGALVLRPDDHMSNGGRTEVELRSN